MPTRTLLGIAAAVLVASVIGCNSSSDPNRPSQEQQRDPAWVQEQIREMDKNLTPDTPVRPKKK